MQTHRAAACRGPKANSDTAALTSTLLMKRPILRRARDSKPPHAAVGAPRPVRQALSSPTAQQRSDPERRRPHEADAPRRASLTTKPTGLPSPTGELRGEPAPYSQPHPIRPHRPGPARRSHPARPAAPAMQIAPAPALRRPARPRAAPAPPPRPRPQVPLGSPARRGGAAAPAGSDGAPRGRLSRRRGPHGAALQPGGGTRRTPSSPSAAPHLLSVFRGTLGPPLAAHRLAEPRGTAAHPPAAGGRGRRRRRRCGCGSPARRYGDGGQRRRRPLPWPRLLREGARPPRALGAGCACTGGAARAGGSACARRCMDGTGTCACTYEPSARLERRVPARLPVAAAGPRCEQERGWDLRPACIAACAPRLRAVCCGNTCRPELGGPRLVRGTPTRCSVGSTKIPSSHTDSVTGRSSPGPAVLRPPGAQSHSTALLERCWHSNAVLSSGVL